MAVLDAESDSERQKRFAMKIHARDETVIAELDRAYAGRIYGLLRGKLQPVDIDSVIQDSLLQVWENFRLDGGNTVAGLLFHIAKKRAIDVIRAQQRQKALIEDAKLTKKQSDFEDAQTPASHLEDKEKSEQDERLLSRISDACDCLRSDRQKIAFRRRFLNGDPTRWAKRLEAETGIPAKALRKASDDAKKQILKKLAESGIVFNGGERHGVA